MNYLVYSALTFAVYGYCGLGLVLWVTPKERRHYALVLAPWVGYCYLTVIAWLFYRYELAVTDHYAPWVMAPPLLFLYLGWRKLAKEKATLGDCVSLRDVLLFIPMLIAFLSSSVAFVLRADHPTILSLGNNDIANYASMARYLQEFVRLSTEGFVGQCGQTGDWDLRRLLDAAYFGPPAATAICSSLFRLLPHQIQSLGINVAFALSTTGVFLLARKALGGSFGLALATAVLFSIHPVVHFIVLHAFYAQVTGMGLMLLLFWTHLEAVEAKTLRDALRFFPLFCIWFWGLSISYSPMLFFTVGLLVFQSGVLALIRKEIRVVGYSIGFCLGAFAVFLLIGLQRVIEMVKLLLFLRSDAGGWFIPLLWPDFLVGVIGRSILMQRADSKLHLVLSVAVAVLLGVTLIVAWREKRGNLVAVGLSAFAVYAGSIVLGFKDASGGVLGGYRSFKLNSFFVPLVLILAMSVFALFRISRRRVTQVLAAAAIALVMVNVLLAQAMYARTMMVAVSVPRAYDDLLAIDENPKYESVNIVGSHFWDIAWKSYFLMHKRQYFEMFTGAGRVEGALRGEWDLQTIGPAGIVEIRDGAEKGLEINSRFRLVHANSHRLTVAFGKGFYASEGTHCWFGSEGRISSLVINSTYPRISVDLGLEGHPFMKENRLTIRLRGETLLAGASGNAFEMKSVELVQGANEFELESKLAPVRISRTGDDRLVTYLLRKVEITKR